MLKNFTQKGGFMDQLLATAHERVQQWITAYPELQLWDDVPWQGGTNQIFYGACAGAPIVFKFFPRKVRKWQEERALQWLAASGVVPRLYPYPSEEILVMQRLPGQMLWQVEGGLSTAAQTNLYRQVGAGLARLVKYAASPADNEAQNPYAADHHLHHFWNSSFEAYFDETLATAQAALARHQINHPALHASIRNLQAVRNEALAYPVFMHVDDVHGANMLVEGDQLQGFIDFEMSRLGNELYLLGTTLQWACLEDSVQWQPLRAGYEEEQGIPLAAETLALIKLFAPFQRWRRFAWYWGSDDQPEWVWRDNVRQTTVELLIKTLTVVDSVVHGQQVQ